MRLFLFFLKCGLCAQSEFKIKRVRNTYIKYLLQCIVKNNKIFHFIHIYDNTAWIMYCFLLDKCLKSIIFYGIIWLSMQNPLHWTLLIFLGRVWPEMFLSYALSWLRPFFNTIKSPIFQTRVILDNKIF